jgi:hypothetical protein
MIIRVLKLGLNETLRGKRLIFYLWALQAFLALAFTWPFFLLLRKTFAHSSLAANLSRGTDLIWLSDIIYNYQNLTPFLSGLGLTLIFIAIPLSLGIDGGILGALKSENSFLFRDFLKAAAFYFYRLLKIFLLFLLSLLFLLLPFSRLLSSIFNLWTEKAASAWPAFWAGLIKFLILLIVYSLLRMFFDYARIIMAIEDNRQALKGLARTAILLSPRLFPAWAVFLLCSLASLALTFLFFLILRHMPTSDLFAFWLSFALGEIYLFLRLAVKVFTFGSLFHWAHLAMAQSQPA